MFRVICIDDKHRPPDVPTTCWIKEGEEYTVRRVGKNKLTGDEYFILEEIQPTPPYGGYHVRRFRLPHEDAVAAQYELQTIN